MDIDPNDDKYRLKGDAAADTASDPFAVPERSPRRTILTAVAILVVAALAVTGITLVRNRDRQTRENNALVQSGAYVQTHTEMSQDAGTAEGCTPSGDVKISKENFPDDALRKAVAAHDVDGDGTLDVDELQKFNLLEAQGPHKSLYDGDEDTSGNPTIESAQGVELLECLTGLYLENNHITQIDLSGTPWLTELELENNAIGTIDLTGSTRLRELDLWGNELDGIDVSGLTQLTMLRISFNDIGSLDVSRNTALEQLYASSCGLSAIDLSANTGLTYLWIGANDLTSLDLTGLTQLESLSADDIGDLGSIDLSHNENLQFLNLADDGLESLDLSHNAALTSITLNRNNLTSLDVSHCTELWDLSVSDNELTTLDVSGLEKLAWLDVSSNKLTYIDLDDTPALERVEADDNPDLDTDLSQYQS